MPRLPPILARLIAFALLLQAGLAPAHCLARAASPAGMETVICTADGMRSLHLGPDGQEMPAQDAGQGVCLACPALPQAALPAAPDLAGRAAPVRSRLVNPKDAEP